MRLYPSCSNNQFFAWSFVAAGASALAGAGFFTAGLAGAFLAAGLAAAFLATGFFAGAAFLTGAAAGAGTSCTATISAFGGLAELYLLSRASMVVRWVNMISMRRLRARPWVLLLAARGIRSPMPRSIRRSCFRPLRLKIEAMDCARSLVRAWLTGSAPEVST